MVLSSSRVGSKTQTALTYLMNEIEQQAPDAVLTYLDLKELEVEFADGRHFLDYKGDSRYVIDVIMQADILFIGSPTYQASIPAPLKNVFDLLPQDALYHKTVGLVMTAGSSKHYLIAETQLKPILTYMKANLVDNYVFIQDSQIINKLITHDDIIFRMGTLVENTLLLARAHQEVWRIQEESYGF